HVQVGVNVNAARDDILAAGVYRRVACKSTADAYNLLVLDQHVGLVGVAGGHDGAAGDEGPHRYPPRAPGTAGMPESGMPESGMPESGMLELLGVGTPPPIGRTTVCATGGAAHCGGSEGRHNLAPIDRQRRLLVVAHEVDIELVNT